MPLSFTATIDREEKEKKHLLSNLWNFGDFTDNFLGLSVFKFTVRVHKRERKRERERERRKPLSCSFLHFLPSPLSAPSPLPAPLHEQKLSGLNQSDEMAQPERQARGNAASHFFNKVLIRDVGAGVRPLHEIGVAVSRRLSGPMEDTGQFVGLLSTSCISQDDTIGRQLIGSRNVLTAPLSGILREGEGVVGGGGERDSCQ